MPRHYATALVERGRQQPGLQDILGRPDSKRVGLLRAILSQEVAEPRNCLSLAVTMGDMGRTGKACEGAMGYMSVIICGVAVALALVALSSASQPRPRAVPAPEMLPDSGRQLQETKAKLDKVVRQLELLNSRLQSIQELLSSGKIEVVVKEAAKGRGN